VADAEGLAWDYVIVGSGAAGGTLAARLVEAGMRVFLLEAGGDARTAEAARLPDDYDVPGFHAFACENPAMSWNFHVRHYADEARQARDPKYDAARQGVLYPRAAALGGCTAHNAMIFMKPHDSDWQHIARITGDASWRPTAMRRHWRQVEACRHRPVWRALSRFGLDLTGHGWDGWLPIEKSIPLEALDDDEIVTTVASTAQTFAASLPNPLRSALHWLRGKGDPNSRPWGGGSFEGLCYTPLSTDGHRRVGARERVLQAQAAHPDRLRIELDALATRVLFDEQGAACGVEYLKGRQLYRAHASPSTAPGERRQVRARREVVLCGGAFNTPQLLMLSGIGPAAHLREHGIAVRADRPGVGRNLQDRYEVAVTHRMRRPWQVLAGARFERGDPLWQLWNTTRGGMYASSGAAVALVQRSKAEGGHPGDPADPAEPDLFCMALPALFEGYRSGFSHDIRDHHDRLTWAVLKAHTANRAGRVTLRSADPREPPQVNFHYFEEGDDAAGSDLRAVVQAIRSVRRLTAPLIERGVINEESAPGAAVQSDEALAEYVRNTAWGHHASCSCAIGPLDAGGVLDSRFAVHGVRGLRVVDASVFPRIPGFFVAAAVYMVGEKAADTILHELNDLKDAGDRKGESHG
jgi:choline dehydrogenase-like flavoprotein